jgi:hypothetical protein
MDRKPVRSSNVASIGYDERSQVLEVEFRDGAIYEYYGVPSSQHLALMRASSIGGYLNANVSRRYRYRRIR